MTTTTIEMITTAIIISQSTEELKEHMHSLLKCRRIVWEHIIWPIIVKTKKPYFTLKEYHLKRDEFISAYNIHGWDLGYGLSSLISRGILNKKDRGQYWIHYRLNPYICRGIELDYGFAIKHVNSIHKGKKI